MASPHATNTVKFAVATSATLIAKLTPQLLKVGVKIASGVIGVGEVLECICECLDQQLNAIRDSNKIAGMVSERCRQLRELVCVFFLLCGMMYSSISFLFFFILSARAHDMKNFLLCWSISFF
jgi:Mg2+/Co2+ transporter CorB